MSDEATNGARLAVIFAVPVPVPAQEVSVAQNLGAAVISVQTEEQQAPAAVGGSGAIPCTVNSKIARLSTPAASGDVALGLPSGIAPETSGNDSAQAACVAASKTGQESGFRILGLMTPVTETAGSIQEEATAGNVSQIDAKVDEFKASDCVVATPLPTEMPLREEAKVDVDAHPVAAIDATVKASQGQMKAVSVGQIEPKPTEKARISTVQTAKSNKGSKEASVESSLEILAGPGSAKLGTTSEIASTAGQSKSGSANETTVKEPQKNKTAAHVAPAVELSTDGSSVASTVHRPEGDQVAEPTAHSIPQTSSSATPITPTEARLVSDVSAGQKPGTEIRAAEPAQRDLPSAGPVREAHMLNRTEQSEMHIGLQTSAFGNVEVHAVVRESQVGLTIGSERGDLRHVLATEVPAVAGRLQEHDLHLDAVRFLDQGPSFDAGSSAADPRGRSFSYSRANTSSGPMQGDATPISDSENLLEQQSGLNVRA